jgi:hypothetical protein
MAVTWCLTRFSVPLHLTPYAQVKAGIWTREFGTNQVVPAAVLTRVFKVHNPQQAQTGGLTIFWAHELAEMGKFIQSTR